MAAPVPHSLGTPAGIKLDNGHATRIVFDHAPTASLWEKQVKPPGLDGGDPIDTTTMRNTTYRTMAPRSLLTLTEMTTTCAYDPNAYNQLVGLINVRTTVTVIFPEGSTLAFFGYLQKFEINDHSEGEQPEATVTIVPTNFDHVNKVEAGPVLTAVAGT